MARRKLTAIEAFSQPKNKTVDVSLHASGIPSRLRKISHSAGRFHPWRIASYPDHKFTTQRRKNSVSTAGTSNRSQGLDSDHLSSDATHSASQRKYAGDPATIGKATNSGTS